MIAFFKLLTIVSLVSLSFSAFLQPKTQVDTTFNSTEGKLAPGLKMVLYPFEYGCDGDNKYITFAQLQNYTNHFEDVCNRLEEGKIYKLGGGGAVVRKGDDCTLNATSSVRADYALCSNYINQALMFVNASYCNHAPFYAPMSDEDASTTFHQEKVCGLMRVDQTIRVGANGTITRTTDASGKATCTYKSCDTTPTEKIACVYNIFNDISPKKYLVDEPCGKGKSLVTVKEVNDNLDAYKKYFKYVNKSVRLAGGALLEPQGDACLTYAFTHRSTIFGLCADIDRN